MKILIVEDEFDLNKSIAKLLKTQHYTTDSAYNGQEALDYVAVSEYDVIILDVMMPKMDGFEFLKELRNSDNQVPVLMLTAKDALEDRVFGLDSGADDYLTKPFAFDELMARLRAMMRRTNRKVLSNIINIHDVEIDLSLKQVRKNKELIDLTGKEYELLEYLARHRNQVLSREQIREHVWNLDYVGESNIIDVLIKNLRRKLDTDQEQSIILTKRGLGYVIPE
ncbi:response regulator transcription factor [Streptococcus sp. CSL10205-OR2]|uniref:response regulator transcription factor n=1 Tax=Streptococcus sp. CSL10205-OR2 TaxID=2980558 RepID=UPI0021DB0620|nr:response regulator transcription factor [Streptococcus sp. CSL10205-OR2]MCU9533586.1 response regulator transcription factor [Streptococcus sp. CSL10205-OR2]